MSGDARIRESSLNHLEGGWEAHLRVGRDVGHPSQGPDSYRHTPEHPKLLRTPPPPGSSPIAHSRSVSQSRSPSESEGGSLRLERLRAEVAELRATAESLGNEGEEMRQAVHEMQAVNTALADEAKELEDGLHIATMRQQEVMEEIEVLVPKHALMKQEHARVMTTIADLRIEADNFASDAAKADMEEHHLEDLMRGVVHRSKPELMEKEKKVNREVKALEEELNEAKKKRNIAKAELARVKGRVQSVTSSWTTHAPMSPVSSSSNLTPEQKQLIMSVRSASEEADFEAHQHDDTIRGRHRSATLPHHSHHSAEDMAFNEHMHDLFEDKFGSDEDDN